MQKIFNFYLNQFGTKNEIALLKYTDYELSD